MAGEDTYHSEHPEANAWLDHLKAQQVRSGSQAAKVQALASEAHLDPEELAGRIPADTLRRLKYPMIERPEEGGLTSFEHDIGVQEGQRALLATDHVGRKR